MLTEKEIRSLLKDGEARETALLLKKDFIEAVEAAFVISDDDFAALVLMSPALGIALAQDGITLYEDLMLSRKGRRLSQKNYFLTKDPVVHGTQLLVTDFGAWENRFYEVAKNLLFSTLRKNPALLYVLNNPQNISGDNEVDLINAPYIFVRFMVFFFLENEEDLLHKHYISQHEFNKMEAIAEKLGIDKIPAYQAFASYFVFQ